MKADWHGKRERGGILALRLIRAISVAFGRRITVLLLWPISLYFCIFSPDARHGSKVFLSRALGRKPARLEIWRHFHTFAVSLLDRLYLAAGRADRLHISIEGQDHLFAALGAGKGCLLIGSHLGSFDVVRACGLSVRNPLKILMHLEQSPAMTSVLYGGDDSSHHTFIPLGTADSFLRAYTELQNGSMVAVLGDRAYRQDKSLAQPFMGAPALFPCGPMLLSAMTGSPGVLFYGLYDGKGRYRVRFEHFSLPDEFTGADRDTAVKSMLSRYSASLEKQARLAPFNWYNFYDFWRDASL